MRAVRVGNPAGLNQLAMSVAEPRSPGEGEILVRIRASSLNYHDYLVVTGGIPTSAGRIPMSDGAGEVVEVGPRHEMGTLASEFSVGDHVVGVFFPRWQGGELTPEIQKIVHGDTIDGFACEYVTMPSSSFMRIPKGYSYEEAATLPCAGLTAWRALVTNGHIKPGEIVLVQGTGGVSIFALQFAKAAGATVIATSSSDAKLDRLRQLGADHVINYRSHPKWGEAASQWTGGRGVDHVIEIGGSGTLAQSIAACRLGGTISMIGVLAGWEGNISTQTLMAKEIRVQGLTVGSYETQVEMIRAIEANDLHPLIDSRFPLENIADAFRHQESGRHFGKICLSI